MKTVFVLVLASALTAMPAIASEPAATVTPAAQEALPDRSGSTDATTRALKARYPARPAKFRADGSVSQYIGASHLMQTVVRIDADGKLEEMCTTDDNAARQFMAAKAASAPAGEVGEAGDPGEER